LPEPYRQFIQAVQGSAAIVATTDSHLVVEFDDPTNVDDMYALAETVMSLQEEINAIGFTEPITIPRPTQIKRKTEGD
jgi:hypothetical protein